MVDDAPSTKPYDIFQSQHYATMCDPHIPYFLPYIQEGTSLTILSTASAK